MVQELASRDKRFRRYLKANGRQLRVVSIPGTSSVSTVHEYPCPSNALPGLTCHSARAKYEVLISSDEEATRVQGDYTAGTQQAAHDGTYNSVLQRVDPDTPLYIGIMTTKDQSLLTLI